MYMYSFLICAAALIASYFIYGKAIERIAGVDESVETPVHRLEDQVFAVGLQGVDHLVHWLLEAVGLLVVVTILYAIGVVVKSIVVA